MIAKYDGVPGVATLITEDNQEFIFQRLVDYHGCQDQMLHPNWPDYELFIKERFVIGEWLFTPNEPGGRAYYVRYESLELPNTTDSYEKCKSFFARIINNNEHNKI